MLTLYYKLGSCPLAAHIVLEEIGEPYALRPVDLAAGEQRTEAFLKVNPQGRVPVLIVDDGKPLAENTAILPYLGKRFGLWPAELLAEANALSLVGFFAASVPSASVCNAPKATVAVRASSERDGGDLGWPPRQQGRKPWSMFGAVKLRIADHGERTGGEQAA